MTESAVHSKSAQSQPLASSLDPGKLLDHTRFELWGLLTALLFYLAAVAGYTAWSYHSKKSNLLQKIDAELLQAARTLKYLLAEDFHDRATAPDAITLEEELRNRKLVTEFGVESGFKWVYTLVEKDGNFFFAAPSVSEVEARERESWYFYPYADIPAEFVRAYRENKTVFVDYTDQWGEFRSVALPEHSPGGRRYLACADRDISEIHALLRNALYETLAVAGYFLLAGLPFVLSLSALYSSHTSALKKWNADLLTRKEHLEEQVAQRTAALEEETRKLQEALANVRTLSGLLPICAACKKIRDDQGYWQKLEQYLQQHSEVVFSHGLCPECAARIYPDLTISSPSAE